MGFEDIKKQIKDNVDKAKKKIDDNEKIKKNTEEIKEKINERLDKLSDKHKIPKKYILIAGITFIIVVLILILSLFKSGSDIGFVKDSYLQGYEGTTIGKAFDNWDMCKNVEWKEIKTKNGMKGVIYICDFKDVDKIKKQAKKLWNIYSNKKPSDNDWVIKSMDIKSIKEIVAFLITDNGDDFEVDSASMLIEWNDGTKFAKNENIDDLLNEIYSDNTSWLSIFNCKIDKHHPQCVNIWYSLANVNGLSRNPYSFSLMYGLAQRNK